MSQRTEGRTRVAKANAKLNLFLTIQNKRQDGLHNVLAVNHEITLFDLLHFDFQADAFRFRVKGNSDVPESEANLVVRAVRKLFERRPKLAITLEKNIPVGAGLGGGSADAATTLQVLNEHFQLGASEEDLVEMATEIGADVPFSLMGGSAVVTGIGDVITRLENPQKPLWFVVADPGVGVDTGKAYSWFDSACVSDSCKPDALLQAMRTNDLSLLSKSLFNAFESVVFERIPAIKNMKEKMLQEGALGALMTGSGSNVFGIVQSEAMGRSLADKISEHCACCWVVCSSL